MNTPELADALKTKIPLRFKANGRFRILMVSDIHGGEGYSPETPRALKALLQKTSPDLVLMGGDIAGPGVIHVENRAQLAHLLDTLCAPMEAMGIPWAHVFGNHDDNFGLSNADQMPVYESYPHCVSKFGPKDIGGTGNYALPVWNAAGDEILFCVYALDSHRNLRGFLRAFGVPEDAPGAMVSGESPLYFEQVLWYYQTSKLLEKTAGRAVPAVMYMHAPLPEMARVCENPDVCHTEGAQTEAVSCAALNSGLFAAMLQRGDVKGVFFGHDHENDCTGQYFGIRLGYDGFLSYHACHNEALRGGRIIDVRAENPADLETRMVRVRDALA